MIRARSRRPSLITSARPTHGSPTAPKASTTAPAELVRQNLSEDYMPKEYVIARNMVTNPTLWSEYAVKAGEEIKKYGGTPIVPVVRGKKPGGGGRARNVVIQLARFRPPRPVTRCPT